MKQSQQESLSQIPDIVISSQPSFLLPKICQAWNDKTTTKINTSYADNAVFDMLQALSCNNILKQADLSC
jgi:hypothetical protein